MAYMFARDEAWRQTAYVKASNAAGGDELGVVALSGEGRVLAVGAPREDRLLVGSPSTPVASSSGAVYVFER